MAKRLKGWFSIRRGICGKYYKVGGKSNTQFYPREDIVNTEVPPCGRDDVTRYKNRDFSSRHLPRKYNKPGRSSKYTSDLMVGYFDEAIPKSFLTLKVKARRNLHFFPIVRHPERSEGPKD